MPRRPDTPCSSCGTLLWSGSASLPAEKRVCRTRANVQLAHFVCNARKSARLEVVP